MVFAINVNEDMVKGSEKLGQSLSGMKEGQEISLYESVISKAYEIKFKPGTIGMILYIMLVYYAYKFALVYLKRYVNVLVLILIAPIVCLMYAFKKVLSGKAITLKKWFKEFIYNVFLQSLHAVMYGTLVGLTLKYSNDGESFLGAILCMILFGVIFKVDKLVRKFFNSVGGDTSVAVSKIDSAFSNTKKAVGTFASGNAQAGATALMYGSKSDEFQNMKSKFGENLNWNKVADTFKGDSKNAWLDMKGGVSDVFGGTKDGSPISCFCKWFGGTAGRLRRCGSAAVEKRCRKGGRAVKKEYYPVQLAGFTVQLCFAPKTELEKVLAAAEILRKGYLQQFCAGGVSGKTSILSVPCVNEGTG